MSADVLNPLLPARPAKDGEAFLLFVEGRGGLLGTRVALHSEVVMGRDPTCGVRLDAEEVSRRHARVAPQGGGHVVGDLGSLNGTWVNGREVEWARLVAGDRIQVGPYVATYLPGSGEPEPGPH